jgi:hypothetical protein
LYQAREVIGLCTDSSRYSQGEAMPTNCKQRGGHSSVSQDMIAEEAREWPGTVLDVPMNCEHGERTDRGVWVVILRCGLLFLDVPLVTGLFPKRDSLGVLGAVPAADLIKCEEARKSVR